ncbi:HpcH/HpaI aldolase family protein [Glacieibacterium frigidum]|uniref:Aldolase n=1 Tax=Glacieibacterium frigidum TaxID=2593303 RepID=A0A552UHT9_9SPHN|nr:aldolase/citrate lyase family protein [Glacieibacterium frigidum]TRW17760.1 aldolase [Glacieibacterium frigidum]
MTLKSRIAEGRPLLGTFVKTPHHAVVEVLAHSSLDLLVLDAEHAPFDRRDLDVCILAARAAGMVVVVRPADGGHSAILNALDCGADGVLVPHVRTAGEARAVAQAAQFGPGGRGYAGSPRAAAYGGVAMAEHRAASAARTVVIAQLEDLEALDDLDAILAVEGIDAFFIGRADLTVALGCASMDDAPVVAAVTRICTAAVAARRPVGMFIARPGDTAQWVEQGATLFVLGSDHGFIRAGAEALRAATGLS